MTGQGTLVGYLRELHVEKGTPSVRAVATATGVARSTVHEMLRGAQLAKWERVQVLLEYYGGDLVRGRSLWEKLAVKRQAGVRDRVVVVDGHAETNRLLGLILERLDVLLDARDS